jgi:hypothetical protein
MVSLIVPYSCKFSRMCSAYADCGLLFFYITCVFAKPCCKTSTCLSYTRFLASIAC